MYGSILFPTDGSPGSERAMEHAMDLARTYEASVHVLYVADRSNQPSHYVMRDDDTGASGMVGPDEVETGSGYTAKGSGMMEAIEDAGEQLVEAVGERFADAGIEVSTTVREGEPYKAINEYAGEIDADLIVMATHGREGLDRYLLGSVTEKIVRTSAVPVLTVRLTEG